MPFDPDRDYYSDMAEDAGILEDEYASNLLYLGWFDTDLDPASVSDAREQFLDYMDWEEWEFDWEDWREYMGYD